MSGAWLGLASPDRYIQISVYKPIGICKRAQLLHVTGVVVCDHPKILLSVQYIILRETQG